MRSLMVAIAAALLLPAAHAQEGKKGMENMDMEKKHGAMHEKMKKKMAEKHATKKEQPSKKDAEHKH